ncbi:hypothetical protein RB195_001748 [Necator americanus]|uniref:Uncharacterized protein n=1 Tax=Necator americanus TaxID=51031 RepID=A0ABR1DFR3_NECAM
MCMQKVKNEKFGRDDGINGEMLSFTSPSGIREKTKIIRSIRFVVYNALELIILDPLIKLREETTRDEQSGLRSGLIRKLLRRRVGYFCPMVCYNEKLYAEVDMVNWRMTRGKHQHHDRRLQDSNQKRPPARKRKFWTNLAKEDLRTFGVDRQVSHELPVDPG